MSEQALDLHRVMQIVWRYKLLLGIAGLVGLLAGASLTMLRPPLLTSKALVVLPPSAGRTIGTQVFIADSYPVLSGAARQLQPPLPLQTLRERVQTGKVSSQIISISAQGRTAAQAEDTANTVARSYLTYVSSDADPIVRVPARHAAAGRDHIPDSGGTPFSYQRHPGRAGRAADRSHHRVAGWPW